MRIVTIAAGQGNVISQATVRLPLTAGSVPEAADRALTTLTRYCEARGLTCSVETYQVAMDDGGYTVTYGSH